MDLHFLYFLIAQKNHSPFNFIYNASELQQRPRFDIIQEALFSTLLSSTNLIPKVIIIGALQYLRRAFTFSC